MATTGQLVIWSTSLFCDSAYIILHLVFQWFWRPSEWCFIIVESLNKPAFTESLHNSNLQVVANLSSFIDIIPKIERHQDVWFLWGRSNLYSRGKKAPQPSPAGVSDCFIRVSWPWVVTTYHGWGHRSRLRIEIHEGRLRGLESWDDMGDRCDQTAPSMMAMVNQQLSWYELELILELIGSVVSNSHQPPRKLQIGGSSGEMVSQY